MTPDEAHQTIEQQRMELIELRAALEQIAFQKLPRRPSPQNKSGHAWRDVALRQEGIARKALGE